MAQRHQKASSKQRSQLPRQTVENLRRALKREREQRKQALEQQTATADILKVISASPSDLQPVFDAIARSAQKLFGARAALVCRRINDVLHLAAHTATTEAGDANLRKLYPAKLTGEGAVGKAVLSGEPAFIIDVQTDPAYSAEFREGARKRGYRSLLAVPMLRERFAIGAIYVTRRNPGPFSEQQVNLLQTFAAQAVIAIENVGLFNETKEALERQTASSEILRVISSSPTDLGPVFDAILESATRLCGAHLGVLNLFEGDMCRTVAQRGGSPEFAKWVLERGPFKPVAAMARILADRRPFHAPDAREGPGFKARDANAMKFVELGGVRSYLAVPLLKDGTVLGSINIFRPEVRLFDDKEIALVSSFANQAVIAIENVRLFNETKESLEQQKASADVLSVISSSIADTQPVFDKILESCARLFDGRYVGINIVRDGMAHLAAYRGENRSEFEKVMPVPVTADSGTGRAILTGEVVHCPDILAGEGVPPYLRRSAEKQGGRAVILAPMLWEGQGIGAIFVGRVSPGPFSEKEIRLLKTFADQAVIAIQNARLFNETKEALEQQKASADVLGAISSSISDTQPVFDKILESCERLFEGHFMGVGLIEDDGFVHIAARRGLRALDLQKEIAAVPFTKESGTGVAVLERRVAHYPDVFGQADVPPFVRKTAQLGAFKSIVFAPMFCEDNGIGAIWVGRSAVGPFTDKQIALLKTFADQAAIAIENVRLFNETKESLERQTATSDVLTAISGAQTDVGPVFEAIALNAQRLCGAVVCNVLRYDGDMLHIAASHGFSPEQEKKLREKYPVKAGDTSVLSGRVIVSRRIEHIDDVQADPAYDHEHAANVAGWRRMLGVPMLRDDEPLGVIVVAWRDPGNTSASEIELLKTFAAQATIAIENVRLFNETKEALEQQKASAEVLGTISSSIADTKPVFEKIVESCARLFEGHYVGIGLIREDGLLYADAYHGPHREEFMKAFPMAVDRNSGTGRAILSRAVVHYPDVIGGEDVPPNLRRSSERVGGKSAMVAPMLWEGRGIGGIVVTRQFAGPFSEKAIRQLKTFADQAVIAIQNARLFREIQEKSAELEVANKHKSDFLANMSHELRTPLNAIIGFSEALMDRMFGDLNEKQLEYQKDIHESGKHLLSLINDILDLSKIEAGRMELELSNFHLPTAVSNAVILVRERAMRHGIELVMDIDQRLGEFRADERKVKQILLNLLSNAVKFTPDGGRVDVSAKLDTDKVEIAVKDTGVGIAPEDQASLFEEFKQLGKDSSRKAEGTGLGLALTKRLVELHGGQVLVDSAVGKGSTFRVLLPARV